MVLRAASPGNLWKSEFWDSLQICWNIRSGGGTQSSVFYFLTSSLGNSDMHEPENNVNDVNYFPIFQFQFSSVTQLCPTLCDLMDCSTPGFPVHHQLLEFSQTHAHSVGDAIQPSHPLSSPSPPALNLSQHQGLFKWVSSVHEVAKVLEFQLQYQSFQWIFRTDFP